MSERQTVRQKCRTTVRQSGRQTYRQKLRQTVKKSDSQKSRAAKEPALVLKNVCIP